MIVTLDTFILGWRPEDEGSSIRTPPYFRLIPNAFLLPKTDHAYNPFLKPDTVGVDIGFTDPAFRKLFKSETGKEVEEAVGEAASMWAHTIFPGYSNSWEDVAFLKEHWDGPIVLKGIQSVNDAKKVSSQTYCCCYEWWSDAFN